MDNLKVEHIDKIEPIDEQEPVSDDIIGKILSDIGYNRLVQEILSLDVIYRDVLTIKLIYEYIVPPNKPCQKSRSIFSVGRIEKGTDFVRI